MNFTGVLDVQTHLIILMDQNISILDEYRIHIVYNNTVCTRIRASMLHSCRVKFCIEDNNLD